MAQQQPLPTKARGILRFDDLSVGLRMRTALTFSGAFEKPDAAVSAVKGLIVAGRMSASQLDHLVGQLQRKKPAKKLSHEAADALLRAAIGEPNCGAVAGYRPLCVDTQMLLEGSSSGLR